MLHSALVHYEQNNIRLRSANLESHTAPFNPHGRRCTPTRAAVPAAYRESPAVLRAEDESGLFHARYDHHAMRLVEQILRNALVSGPHHVVQRVGRSVQPIIDLGFSFRRESGGTH